MHLKYCPTVTSQFTIKIRFCFLLSSFFFFPPLLSLPGLSAQLGKLCACRSGPPRGSWVRAEQVQVHCVHHQGGEQEGPLLCAIWRVFVLQINCSLASDSPIVRLLSSVGVVVVNRQMEMWTIVGYRTINDRCLRPAQNWRGGVAATEGRPTETAPLKQRQRKANGTGIDLYLTNTWKTAFFCAAMNSDQKQPVGSAGLHHSTLCSFWVLMTWHLICRGNYFTTLSNSLSCVCRAKEAVFFFTTTARELKIALNKQVIVEGKHTIIHQTAAPCMYANAVLNWLNNYLNAVWLSCLCTVCGARGWEGCYWWRGGVGGARQVHSVRVLSGL